MSVVLPTLCVSIFLALAAAVVTLHPGQGVHRPPLAVSAEMKVESAIRARPSLQQWIRGHLDRRSAGVVLVGTLLVVLFAVAAIVGTLLRMVTDHTGLADIDSAVARWGAAHATSGAVTTARLVTQLGSTTVAAGALATAVVLELRRGGPRSTIGFAAAIVAGQLVLTNALKIVVHRSRPDVLRLMAAGGYSFPSGHSASAAAAWSAIALIAGRNHPRTTRIVLNGAAALIAGAVATSRALLGVHWFTDVMAGLALGWGWYLMVAVAFGGSRQRLGEPVERAVPALDAQVPSPEREQ